MEHQTANQIDPWKVAEADFLSLDGPEARSCFILNYAVLAPSRLNTQPWLFSVFGDRIDVFADRRRALAVSDPEDRDLTMACGAALHHLELAMRRFGHEPRVMTFPDLDREDLLASVWWGEPVSPEAGDVRSFKAITRRRVLRGSFEQAGVPDSAVGELELAPGRSNAEFRVVRDQQERSGLVDMVRRGITAERKDPRLLRETASWTHPDRRWSLDGLPVGEAARRIPSRSRAINGRELPQLDSDGPVVGLLTSRNDSHACWLEAGRTLARVALAAARHQLVTAHLDQPLIFPDLREEVSHAFGRGRRVQAIIQVGYSRSSRRLSRRPVAQVMVGAQNGQRPGV